MKHLFVTYEISVKLKELGFNEPCFAYYINKAELLLATYSKESNEYPSNSDLIMDWVSTPTHQQAVDFIREKLDIQINITWNKFYEKTPYQWEYRPTWRNQLLRPYGVGSMSESYNEALASAIMGALNYQP